MNNDSQSCPQCQCHDGYFDGTIWVCPECFHEWNLEPQNEEASFSSITDSNGVELADGDTVVIVKDLKLGNDTLKSGTKVKKIKLLQTEVDGHNISCKIPGHGSMYLKGSVVKKSK